MRADLPPSRLAANRMIANHATRQVRSFFDEIKNGSRNYRTVASLGAQVAQEYRGRCVLELLQNAHDALAEPQPNDPRRISFTLHTNPEPMLLIGNTGNPFHYEDFQGICELAQSPKDPNERIGNKGLGFRSVLEVSGRPQIWSTPIAGSGLCFAFRFDPDSVDLVAQAAQALEQHGIDTRSPFDDGPLLDWSQDQLRQFLAHVAERGLDVSAEARKFLSPYLLPLVLEEAPSDVQTLLDAGHATVVRLPLDGGNMLSSADAVQSVEKQLDDLRDVRSVVFLDRLAELVIEVDGDRHCLRRTVHSDSLLAGPKWVRQHELRIQRAAPLPDNVSMRHFRVWSRVVGGNEDPAGAERIHRVVSHLPNRWPEVRQARVGVAVEDVPEQPEGVFVIFLPTEQATGTGAHINAPFYGSLDRRQIDFEETYNALILDEVLDLCLDTIGELKGGDESWKARAIVDIMASRASVGGEHWYLTSKLLSRAEERCNQLADQAIIFCDNGWRTPQEARLMPAVRDGDQIGVGWRRSAAFSVVSEVLDGRRRAIERLLRHFPGSPSPTDQEWIKTVERVARQIGKGEIDVKWGDFMCSLLEVLPGHLRDKPVLDIPDPLAGAHFLPTSDGRQVAASSPTKLFFRPIQGIDDLAESVGDVPRTLRERIAFLHPDVQTHEGPARSNTDVQKFLEGRFVKTYRTEEILRDVVIPAIPPLPVAHGSAEAVSCAEILAWTLGLIQDTTSDALLPFLRALPASCYGGWFRAGEASFGPGWLGRHGGDVSALVAELPARVGSQLGRAVLLPPHDERWLVEVDRRSEFLARAGVVDGLRLHMIVRAGKEFNITFDMDAWSNDLIENLSRAVGDRHPLHPVAPTEAYADWYSAVEGAIQPYYVGSYEYELSGLRLLPEIHYLDALKRSGRRAFSNLLLRSIGTWSVGWESVTIRKRSGNSWAVRVTSPLKHWLQNMPWLSDRDRNAQPLWQRWLVPESLLRGQSGRYAHLDPLALDLVKRIGGEPTLQDQLVRLELNVYPTEGDRTGPALLDALAKAWARGRVPAGRFDVFLGQVREAWRFLDSEQGLPAALLVRTGRRSFALRPRNEMTDVFLPDDRDRSRALRSHGKGVLDMGRADATRLADALVKETGINLASQLDERHEVDGSFLVPAGAEAVGLDASAYAWLSVVLLSVAAYGGTNPVGTTTRAWREAAIRLRRTRVVECNEIITRIVHNDNVVAESQPMSQWLPGDVLVVRRDMVSHEDLALAGQAILNRQDISKDLLLVLGALPAQRHVTRGDIEAALEKAEIDSQMYADVQEQWIGDMGTVVDRVRPVLRLLQVSEDGLETAARDTENLTAWLTSNLPCWDAAELLSAARRSHDDYAMGMAAWYALGEVARLPNWNGVLAELGGKYDAVENPHVFEQTKDRIDEAKTELRAFARHVALAAADPSLFRRVEEAVLDFDGDATWSNQWWNVPFSVVIDSLTNHFREIAALARYVDLIRGSETADDLRDRLERNSNWIIPDPYETADANRHRLQQTLSALQDIHREWIESDASRGAAQLADPSVMLDGREYLHDWSDIKVLEMAFRALNDEMFEKACVGCSTLDAIRCRLDVTSQAIEQRRNERQQQEREAERRRLTHDVAGHPFEVGTTSYRDLFDRLSKRTTPDGPRASKDELTTLLKVGGRKAEAPAEVPRGSKAPPVRPPAHFTDLVGVVGEILAFQYLRSEFGEAFVKRECWVSEIRRSVLPPTADEPHTINDGLGFDFRFKDRRRRTWCVEVKATAGDDSSFDLGISEIRAATQLARSGGGQWRILRVRNALSVEPEVDWLPNPFEDEFKDRFRLHRGGMRVSYRVGES